MTKSMTGYGQIISENGSYTIQAELKTLNSKFFDLSLRLPKELSALEYNIRDILSKGLVRGKASFSLEIELQEGAQGSVYNADTFNALFKELKTLSNDYQVSEADIFNNVLKLPEVLQQTDASIDQIDEERALTMVQEVVGKCDAFRIQEGQSLETALMDSISSISGNLQLIKEHEPSRTQNIKARISDSMNDLIDKTKIDENRFEQELIYYIEKLDINEELVRLSNHLKYFEETIALPTSQGKKLGFIGQEMGREINTIGSKANDVTIQRLVVEMKDELEKIKEQISNIL
ncbi:MAG: YicC family protein [Cyclobacteriaceae bacterium]